MTITDFINSLDAPDNLTSEDIMMGFSAENAINGFKDDEPRRLRGHETLYLDRDLPIRFRRFIPEKALDRINDRLNKNAVYTDGGNCPNCGELIDRESHFCKYCGQHIFNEPDIGETLRKKRKSLKLTQGQIGDYIGKTNQMVHAYESGKKIPEADDLKKLSHLFKCSVNEFYNQGPSRHQPKMRLPEDFYSYQNYNRAGFEPEKIVIEEDDEGYEIGDKNIIQRCPCCGREVDFTVDEALTISLSVYEELRMKTTFNDGIYCKHCGQRLERVFPVSEEKEFQSYRFWTDRVLESLRKRY